METSEMIPVLQISAPPKVDTGSIALDWALKGGIYQGSLVTISGDAGIGKTTLLLSFLSSYPGKVIYMDLERKLARSHVEKFPDLFHKMIIGQDEKILLDLVFPAIDIMVIDSLASLSPEFSMHTLKSYARENNVTIMMAAQMRNHSRWNIGHIREGSYPHLWAHLFDIVIDLNTNISVRRSYKTLGQRIYSFITRSNQPIVSRQLDMYRKVATWWNSMEAAHILIKSSRATRSGKYVKWLGETYSSIFDLAEHLDRLSYMQLRELFFNADGKPIELP